MEKIILLLCVLLPASGLAQSYSIPWYKIAGGGGTSTGGTYAVSGTIGQPDASGPMTGGNYSLTGGFWSFVSVVSSPGAPTLTIERVNKTTVEVLWPYPSTGWTLQQNTTLSTAGWADSSGVSNDGVNNYLLVSPPQGNVFYRLKQ
ncbi:MAG: hypothetical protein ABSH48_12200 [Verrucomicrobiota bacterium]|jgi:hypothetical protein